MNTDKEISQQNQEFELKKKELELKELERKDKKLLEIIKIITTGVVVTLIPTIDISNNCQNKG